MKLKVCGMKYNPLEVVALQPDYMGFIFWEPSARYFDKKMPMLPENIKKIGVFVDAKIEEVLQKVQQHDLDGVQLHGEESADYCKELQENLISFRAGSRKNKSFDTQVVSTPFDLDIIKVFTIKDEFDFSLLVPYEEVCDYYLFDTKGKLPGGTGLTFDWSVLKDYPSTKPFFLSGGIGLETIDNLLSFLQKQESKLCHAIDVNSRFESKPGAKNIEHLKEFKKQIIARSETTK